MFVHEQAVPILLMSIAELPKSTFRTLVLIGFMFGLRKSELESFTWDLLTFTEEPNGEKYIIMKVYDVAVKNNTHATHLKCRCLCKQSEKACLHNQIA